MRRWFGGSCAKLLNGLPSGRWLLTTFADPVRGFAIQQCDRSLWNQIIGSESFRICIHRLTMGRPRQFSREEVLEKAISVFWAKGFSETTLQDLEAVTGVNKSGLYSEFKNKEEISLSLQHYLQTRGGDDILSVYLLGWSNIQRFLEIGQTCYTGRREAVSPSIQCAMFPCSRSRAGRSLLKITLLSVSFLLRISGLSPGRPNAAELADMVLTFFSGLCIEENLRPRDAEVTTKVQRFLKLLKRSA